MRKYIETTNAPKAIGPYSQAVMIDNTLYCSGQIAISPETNEFVGGDIKSQTEQVIKNINAVLKESGMDFNDVIKTTCFLKNIDDFAEFNEIYAQYFVSKPARSTVEVAKLPKNALVEIEIIAIKQ